jgi:Pectate lyase superfamily protein
VRNFSQLLLIAGSFSLLGGCASGGGGNITRGGGPQATQFSLSGPSSSGAGFAFNFTVTARDAANNLVANYSGTVHFTSSDPAAVLPPNSTLMNGIGSFSATLKSAGLQIITATDTSSASLLGSLSINAVAGDFPVNSFGAKGDGHTDDTAAIQSAINAASAAGGGSVVLNVARYYTAGTLVVPAGVVLCGPVQGPFDVPGINPATTVVAPTLLITNTSGPFITLQGIGAGVTDLLFHYPNQVASSAAAPNVYPYTILVTAPGTKVARSTVTNAYNFLDIEVGRVTVQDMFIGAFDIGINVDHALDHVILRNLIQSVFWDIVENAPVPSPIDTWVSANGTAFVVGRVDSLEVSDVLVFIRFTGFLLTDSSDKSQNPTCGYGTGSDIDLDTVQYGIVVTASNSLGYKFTNVDIGSGNGGQAALQVRTGGSLPPKIEINGGSQRGFWAAGAYPSPAPDTVVVNILP